MINKRCVFHEYLDTIVDQMSLKWLLWIQIDFKEEVIHGLIW